MKSPISGLALLALLPLLAIAENESVEEVIVVAHPLSGEGLSQAFDVVEGDELLRDAQSSIGETLSTQPGVHSSSFGQASSRPIIHGLGGARVRVMEDRIDTLDASVTSGDHAVSVESFIADRIEVLKGPSTLLYGAGAIGGVVDVHTGRIPHGVTSDVSGRAELRVTDNASRKVAAARLDGGLGRLAWHVDGFSREADAYEIPGEAESRFLDDADENGRFVPGSQLESTGGALGLSAVRDDFFIGAAFSTSESLYGLPGGHGHEDEHEDEHEDDHDESEDLSRPALDMDQTRLDFEMGWQNPFRGVSSLNIRSAFNDYEHQEIEADRELATQFFNKASESRIEFVYDDAGFWAGALGAQLSQREFAAVGEEAFVPPVDTRALGLFWVGERSFGERQFETGFRVDAVSHDPTNGPGQNFRAFGASLGLIVPFDNGWQIGWHADYASRAPVAEELYSNGPHLATQSFELGDTSLDEESALNLSATLDYSDEQIDWVVTAYFTQFADFIYQSDTGETAEGLPILRYTQDDVRFVGVDAEVSGVVAQWDSGQARMDVTFDTVSARIDKPGNDNLPRIPPSRLGVALHLLWSTWDARLAYFYNAPVSKSRTAALELPTDGYSELRLSLGKSLQLGDSTLKVFLHGRNLTDEEQRPHVSLLKDTVPLPGRTIEAGVRLQF